MLATARQLQPEALNPADWLTVEQAAELTGEPVRTWQWRARAEAAEATRAGRRALACKAPAAGSTRLVWYLHRRYAPGLSRTPTTDTRDERGRPSLLARYPQHQVELAYRKNHWLQAWLKAKRLPGETDRTRAERIVRAAKQAEGAAFPISFRSLQAWRAAYQRMGPDRQILGVEGLIDRRAVGASETDDEERGRRDPKAVEFFYGLYHTQSRQSVTVCHEVTRDAAEREGWAWPASTSATVKWLNKHDNLALTCLMRDGPDTWCRKYMPHLEVDYTLIEPGELYQTDHHQCDFWVEHDGKQLRPWLTAVQDARSRCIVGWHLGPSPHQDAIIAAYLMAFRDWAISAALRIDNGRDFASELLAGVTKAQRDQLRRKYGPDWRKVLERDADLVACVDARFKGIVAELGTELVYAIPYAPWSKGQTERWFGTFEARCGKTFATYCGNSSLRRPECLEVIRRGYTKEQKRRLRKKHGKAWKREAVLRLVDPESVPTMEQAREAVANYIEEYHHSNHSAADLAGLTPLQCWNTAKSLRRAGEAELLFMMQARGLYKVGANGVRLKVGSETVGYGAACPALYRYAGRDVCITLDPNDLSCCHAFAADRSRYIGRLSANDRISPRATVDDLREASAKVGRRRKIMHEAQRTAPRRTRTAVAELTAPARAKAAERRATGTDGRTASPRAVPIATGFEECVQAAQRAAVPGDRQTRDLSDAAEALGFNEGYTPAKERGDEGTDAGPCSSELLKLVGDRHDRET